MITFLNSLFDYVFGYVTKECAMTVIPLPHALPDALGMFVRPFPNHIAVSVYSGRLYLYVEIPKEG